MDEWIPSYQNLYSITALECKLRLAQGKVIPIRVTDFLQYTRQSTFDPLRLAAFENMIELGLLKNDAVLEWFLTVLGSDPSPFVRERMHRLLGRGLAIIAIGEGPSKDVAPQQNSLIIEQESSTESRQADLARKQSVNGALTALKQEVGSNAVLKRALWEAVTSPVITLFEIRNLLDICSLLYEPITSMIIALKYPRYWKVENLGHVRPHRLPMQTICLPFTGKTQVLMDRQDPNEADRKASMAAGSLRPSQQARGSSRHHRTDTNSPQTPEKTTDGGSSTNGHIPAACRWKTEVDHQIQSGRWGRSVTTTTAACLTLLVL